MIIEVTKKLKPRKKEIEFVNFGWLPMLKHVGCAGNGFKPTIGKIIRSLGFLFFFHSFLRPPELKQNHFSEPNDNIYDPTEKNNFSNLIGKAVADFLAKKYYNTKLTQTYEAAMLEKGFPIKGSRPDLLCFTEKAQFSVEAKGFSVNSISENEMKKHKRQSKKGPLSVAFSVASVTYSIYDNIKSNFYDPPGDGEEIDRLLFNSLALKYYSNIFNDPLFDSLPKQIVEYENNSFIKVRLSPFFYDFFPFIYSDDEIYYNKMLPTYSILIDKRIEKFINEGDFLKYEFFGLKSENVYIDKDGLGISKE
jgi:hypothetical protein